MQGPDLERGLQTVGKYRLIAKLGEGGMAHVFLAVAHGPIGFSKLFVLKLVRPQLAEDPDILHMFLDEARLAGKLNHANVVQTYEVGEVEGRYVLVMEYLDGQPLRALQRRMHQTGGTIPLPLQLKVLIDALSGLHYAHELQDYGGAALHLVHRDVSPHNIFITYDGQVKVLDFGIAKAATSSQETQSGVIKGKVSYMAPEQISSGAIDRRADIYSMGAILWQTATGYRLWKGATDAQVLYSVTNGRIPRPSDVRPGVPLELERICMRALAYNPEERYPTAKDLQQDLRVFASELSTAVSALELGAFVAKEFAQERRDLRERLEQLAQSTDSDGRISLMNLHNPLLETGSSGPRWSESLGRVWELTPTPGSVPGPASSSAPSYGMTPSNPPGSGSVLPSASESSPSQYLAVADSSQHRKPSRKGIFIAVVAGGLLALGATGAIAAHLFVAESPIVLPQISSSASALVQVPASVPTDTIIDTEIKTVEIEIKASPIHAQIFLNGRELSTNPATEQLEKDGSQHVIRIEAAGYSTRTMEIVADRNARLEVELLREPSRVSSPTPKTPDPLDTKTGKPPPVKTTKPGPVLKTDNIDPWEQ